MHNRQPALFKPPIEAYNFLGKLEQLMKDPMIRRYCFNQLFLQIPLPLPIILFYFCLEWETNPEHCDTRYLWIGYTTSYPKLPQNTDKPYIAQLN